MTDVPDADLIQKATRYVRAYDAWWSGLMRPPFNDGKPPDHRALCKDAREAWRAFDWALNERGMATKDRYALARELTRGEGAGGQ